MAASFVPVDLGFGVDTPENIRFDYQLAGPFKRLPAFVIDFGLRVTIYVAFFFLAMIFFGLVGFLLPSGALLAAASLILYFLMSWFYGVFFEGYWNGQTPGKRLCGIRVVTYDGRPINFPQAFLRNLLRVGDFSPMISIQFFFAEAPNVSIVPTFLLGFCAMMLTRRFQRIGDIAAGTMVIVDERSWYTSKVQFEDHRVAALAEFIPPNFRMSRKLGQAISLYVSRRAYLSKSRRAELSQLIARPLIKRFGFMSNTDSDLLLCAIYHRNFISKEAEAAEAAVTSVQGSPLIADNQVVKQAQTIAVPVLNAADSGAANTTSRQEDSMTATTMSESPPADDPSESSATRTLSEPNASVGSVESPDEEAVVSVDTFEQRRSVETSPSESTVPESGTPSKEENR